MFHQAWITAPTAQISPWELLVAHRAGQRDAWEQAIRVNDGSVARRFLRDA